MAVSPAARVGIIILIAVIAFLAVAVFLLGERLRGYPITVVFPDALGLTPGSEVRMAGVRIGSVDEITLTANQKAAVRMKIDPRYKIPDGSEFILRVGLLIGDRYVDIIPNRETTAYVEPGTVVSGQMPIRIDDLLPAVQDLIANLTAVSEDLEETLGDDEFEKRIKRSLANIESATASLNRAMGTVELMIAGQQDEVQTIANNVVLASENLRDLTSELEAFASEGQLQETIGETLTSAQRTAASLDRTAASLEALITEPEFQENIKGTAADAREAVREAREALAQAQAVIGRVGRIVGVGGGGPKLPKTPIRETGLDSLYRPEDGRFRATLSTKFVTGEDDFLALGIYDIGAGNKLILQSGEVLDPRTDFRYGIYASRFGIGLDHAFSSRTYTNLNLYDSYHPRLDVQAGYNLTDDWGVLIGVDRLFDENQLTLGVRLTK